MNGDIDSSESNPGLHKCLQIRALACMEADRNSYGGWIVNTLLALPNPTEQLEYTFMMCTLSMASTSFASFSDTWIFFCLYICVRACEQSAVRRWRGTEGGVLMRLNLANHFARKKMLKLNFRFKPKRNLSLFGNCSSVIQAESVWFLNFDCYGFDVCQPSR